MEQGAARELTAADFTRLIQTHQAGVWRYLRSLGCEPSEADDLTQETFLAIWKRPFAEYSSAATAAYLRKSAHNLYISFRRKMGRIVLGQELDEVHLEEVHAEWERWAADDQGEAVLEALKKCLQSLTQRARWALETRFRERLSRANIAAALQISEHGARNLMQRAKQQLRTCVDDNLPSEET